MNLLSRFETEVSILDTAAARAKERKHMPHAQIYLTILTALSHTVIKE